MPATDDEELRIVFQKIARRIRNSRTEGELGDSQLSVLALLDIHGPRTPSDLAARERVTPPSMNRTLNGLEASGFVTRTRSADDARKVLVDLTPAARELLATTRRERHAWFSQHLARLSADERAALDAVLPVLRRLAAE